MRLTLGRKLGMSFGVILALMVVSSLMSYVKVKQPSLEETLYQFRVPTLDNCRKIQSDLNYGGKSAAFHPRGNPASPARSAQKAFDKAWENVGKHVQVLTELSTRLTLQENRDRLAQFKELSLRPGRLKGRRWPWQVAE